MGQGNLLIESEHQGWKRVCVFFHGYDVLPNMAGRVYAVICEYPAEVANSVGCPDCRGRHFVRGAVEVERGFLVEFELNDGELRRAIIAGARESEFRARFSTIENTSANADIWGVVAWLSIAVNIGHAECE